MNRCLSCCTGKKYLSTLSPHNNDFSTIIIVPTTLTFGTALTSSVGSGSINYYQYYFPSNGITIKLNVGIGTISCYISDRFQNPNEEQYDWFISVSDYSDIFIDPNLLDRTPGSNIYIGLLGIQSSNTFTLDSTTGDTRGRYHYSLYNNVSLCVIFIFNT